MTDEVGNTLTGLGRLRVKARGIVVAAWGHNSDPLSAARTLQVAWYVHGSVWHVTPQLLVNIELVRLATGEQVWAERFARSDDDLFAVQAEIAESVAVAVGGQLAPSERAVTRRRPTKNNEAYRLYLLGNTLFARRSPPEVRRALEAYTQAVHIDPTFASAWARIGLARAMEAAWGWDQRISGDSLRMLADAAAGRALTLDSSSAEAWLAVAFLAEGVAGSTPDVEKARHGFERSLALDSLNPETWHLYGAMYGWLVIDTAAVPLFQHALSLNPTLRAAWLRFAGLTMQVGRLSEAEALCDTALAFGPWSPALEERAYVRFYRRNALGALADLDEAERLDSDPRSDARALFSMLLGDSAGTRSLLTRLRAQADSGQQVIDDLAMIAMSLGLRSEALAALERLRATLDPREPRCASTTPCSASLRTWELLHNPVFAPLRGDQRFERLWEETRPRLPWLEGSWR